MTNEVLSRVIGCCTKDGDLHLFTDRDEMVAFIDRDRPSIGVMSWVGEVVVHEAGWEDV